LDYLRTHQRPDGSWTPLWFGNQQAPAEENLTYGTAKVLQSLSGRDEPMVERGRQWLLRAQNPDGGWGGAAGAPSSIEETALALEALTAVGTRGEVLARGVSWLVERTQGGTAFSPTPIGFYFAKLWYYEELYSVLFTLGALNAMRL
jgi:squalene-hopene/tetraprenyl-beta-curcumene cyclase